jgi:hypothetical protein
MSDSGDEKPGIWLRLLLVTFIPLLMLYLLEPILLENIVFFLIALFVSFYHAHEMSELVRKIVARKLGMKDAWTDMKLKSGKPLPLKEYHLYIKYRSDREPTKKEIRMISTAPFLVNLICMAVLLWLAFSYNLTNASWLCFLFIGHFGSFIYNVKFL